MADMVTIPKKEYEALKRASSQLACLECAGVDNWSGYGECYDNKCDGYIATIRREDV